MKIMEWSRMKYVVLVVAILLVRIVLGLLLDEDELHVPFYHINLLMIYGIGAIGLALLTGYAGQISMGNSAFFAIGAFFSAWLTLTANVPFWVAIPLAGLLSAVFGYVLGVPALRLAGNYLAIATLGFGIAIPQILNKWESFSGGFSGLKPHSPEFFGFKLKGEEDYFFVVFIILVLLTWAALNLVKSRTGRAFISLRDSEIAAQAMGINLTRYKTMAFAISAFYAGVAGCLYGHMTHFISAGDFGLQLSLDFLTMITIGGLASIPGALVGAGFLTLLKPVVNAITAGFPPGVRAIAQTLPQVITGVVLVLVVIYLPTGLISLWNRAYNKIFGKSKQMGGGKHVSVGD